MLTIIMHLEVFGESIFLGDLHTLRHNYLRLGADYVTRL